MALSLTFCWERCPWYGQVFFDWCDSSNATYHVPRLLRCVNAPSVALWLFLSNVVFWQDALQNLGHVYLTYCGVKAFLNQHDDIPSVLFVIFDFYSLYHLWAVLVCHGAHHRMLHAHQGEPVLPSCLWWCQTSWWPYCHVTPSTIHLLPHNTPSPTRHETCGSASLAPNDRQGEGNHQSCVLGRDTHLKMSQVCLGWGMWCTTDLLLVVQKYSLSLAWETMRTNDDGNIAKYASPCLYRKILRLFPWSTLYYQIIVEQIHAAAKGGIWWLPAAWTLYNRRPQW